MCSLTTHCTYAWPSTAPYRMCSLTIECVLLLHIARMRGRRLPLPPTTRHHAEEKKIPQRRRQTQRRRPSEPPHPTQNFQPTSPPPTPTPADCTPPLQLRCCCRRACAQTSLGTWVELGLPRGQTAALALRLRRRRWWWWWWWSGTWRSDQPSTTPCGGCRSSRRGRRRRTGYAPGRLTRSGLVRRGGGRSQ